MALFLQIFCILFIFINSVHGTDENDDSSCNLNGYVASCTLDILEEHIVATAVINHCHVPVDVTFNVLHQLDNRTRHTWQYTFVTSNQNERVRIPGLLLPTAPHAPVYLYIRVPEVDFNAHNASYISVEASFIAELSPKQWEEVEFLNHTVPIPSINDCQFHMEDRNLVPWILGGSLIIILMIITLFGAIWWLRNRKIVADQLALVMAIEVGLPGAQPYQVDPTQGDSNPKDPAVVLEMDNNVLPSESESVSPACRPDSETQSGLRGFRFRRLREEPNGEPPVEDSVVIGNPAFEDDMQCWPGRLSLECIDKSEDLEPIPKSKSKQSQQISKSNGFDNICKLSEDSERIPKHKSKRSQQISTRNGFDQISKSGKSDHLQGEEIRWKKMVDGVTNGDVADQHLKSDDHLPKGNSSLAKSQQSGIGLGARPKVRSSKASLMVPGSQNGL